MPPGLRSAYCPEQSRKNIGRVTAPKENCASGLAAKHVWPLPQVDPFDAHVLPLLPQQC